MVLAAACGGAAAPAEGGAQPTLVVDLSDYKLVTDHPSVPAGHIVFGIRNHASMLHDMKVIKTDLPEDKLPIDTGTAKATEAGLVGGVENIPGGASRKLELDLQPGHYVLICNVAGHYQLGMHATLEVK